MSDYAKNVSVIIINYNTGQLLRDCVDSVFEQMEICLLEVIVVDNASGDESFLSLPERPGLIKIKNKENLGFAAANNQAITQSRGTYLFFLNPDTKIANGQILQAVEFLAEKGKRSALGFQLLDSEGRRLFSCRRLPCLRDVWAKVFFNRDNRERRIFPRQIVEQPMGAALLVKKAVIDQIGAFDERFFLYYEDVDLCRRIKDSGGEIYFYPEIEIIHHGCVSAFYDFPATLEHNYRSFYQYFRKYYSGRITLILKPLMLLEILKKIVFFSLVASLSPRQRRQNSQRLKGYRTILAKNIFL
ncbi:MAG: glycosyltransferase family 2 protein [Candidatus Omnitrophica bacterium]|nr:glycosyltransferase family 2 protein [Candidatus Omnitrophota bacterium]MBU1924687.1 glycosyltransferase family 2 protein [Candidatus Omnitrophota bacterium]